MVPLADRSAWIESPMLLSIVPLWAKALIVAAIVAAFGGWCWTGGKASERKVWQLKEAAQVAAQLAATEQARATEQALQLKVTEANNARAIERAKAYRIAAGLRADADRLRGDIAQFASGSAEDTASACRDRSATLGSLLDDALRTSGECAAQAESVAADLRATLAAWPD
jgi:hypothetical protein